MSRFSDIVARLDAVIVARKGADPASSYTARLLAGGPPLAAKKFGEEAIEAVLAAAQGDRDALAAESADVIYHWLVLLAASGVSLDEVAAKLEAREGTSGIDEKASRGG
jgi:phosphoribosyl-ATP pyrophosphohydrolase